MPYFKKIETPVLLKMIAAYSADYGGLLTEIEYKECKNNISLIESEIETRKQATAATDQPPIINDPFLP
jgi:hypothetical protein